MNVEARVYVCVRMRQEGAGWFDWSAQGTCEIDGTEDKVVDYAKNPMRGTMLPTLADTAFPLKNIQKPMCFSDPSISWVTCLCVSNM